MSDNVNREYESDYANYVLNPSPETLVEQVDLERKARKENPSCHCTAVDLPAGPLGLCPICGRPK